MSRCVPFPPPGFVWNGVSGTDLSKLIQVRRENAAVEKRRNEEKRRRKKENEELKERDIRERVCALFPPPGFAWNGLSDEALSGLVKVIREKTASEMKRKKKKKEEKRRRKNENEELEKGEIKEIVCISSSQKHKKCKKCEKTSSSEHEKHENKLLLELERSSCLTEEHEQPITTICCDHTNSLMYDSSDNTENVRPKFVTPDKSRLAAASKSILSTTTFVDDHENVESQFTELIVNFAPPPPLFIQTEQLDEFDDDVDQEWFFERRLSRRNPPAVSSACNDDDSWPGSSSMYPCPRYLPEADIYAMPYTMLF